MTCPETGRLAAVRIDAGHAASTTLIEDTPLVRLAQCSRWPSRGPCDEPCLPDVAAAGGAAVDWSDVAPERVPEMLRTHRPVCRNCQVAEKFCWIYPELVTDRDAR